VIVVLEVSGDHYDSLLGKKFRQRGLRMTHLLSLLLSATFSKKKGKPPPSALPRTFWYLCCLDERYISSLKVS